MAWAFAANGQPVMDLSQLVKSYAGSWGLCPACECGGRERPCWQCGYDGKFTMGVNHLTHPDVHHPFGEFRAATT